MEISGQKKLDLDLLEKLCPFYFVLNSSDAITETGTAFHKMFPNVFNGTQFSDFFSVSDSADFIQQKLNKYDVCIITERGTKKSMKVKSINIDAERILYVGFPVLTSGLSLKDYNISINDLPQHDSTIEMLFMLEAMKRSISESEENITALNSANKKLEQANVTYKQTEKLALTGSWYMSFSSGVAEWSDMCCKIYGIPAAENKQSFEEWLSFIHPEDLPELRKKIEFSERGKSALDFTGRIITKSGHVKYVHQYLT